MMSLIMFAALLAYFVIVDRTKGRRRGYRRLWRTRDNGAVDERGRLR